MRGRIRIRFVLRFESVLSGWFGSGSGFSYGSDPVFLEGSDLDLVFLEGSDPINLRLDSKRFFFHSHAMFISYVSNLV